MRRVVSKMAGVALVVLAAAGAAHGEEVEAPAVTEIRLDSDYEVVGRSAFGIRRSLNERRIAAVGMPYDAITSTTLRWFYARAPAEAAPSAPSAANACAIRRPRVELWIEVTLPRWVGASLPPRRGLARLFQRALLRRWARYLEALTTHEEGHVEIGRRVAADLHRDLSSLPIQDCSQLDARVEALGRAAVDRLRAEHVRYDADTRHGLATGAVFP